MADPTRKRLTAESPMATARAAVPDPSRNGTTGMNAPTAKDPNDDSAATHGDPRSPGARPSSSRVSVSRAVSGRPHDPPGQRLGLVVGEALGLVDEDQLLELLLGEGRQLLPLDGDLPLVELPLRLHRHPFAGGHGEGAGQQAGQAGQQDDVAVVGAAGHAEDQQEVRDEAVVDAEDAGPRARRRPPPGGGPPSGRSARPSRRRRGRPRPGRGPSPRPTSSPWPRRSPGTWRRRWPPAGGRAAGRLSAPNRWASCRQDPGPQRPLRGPGSRSPRPRAGASPSAGVALLRLRPAGSGRPAAGPREASASAR